MAKTPVQRYRFTVPEADVSINEWIGMQNNLSFSLRMLIRDFIERNGMTDATCSEVVQLPRRGRPPKVQESEELQNAESYTSKESYEPPKIMASNESYKRDEDGFVNPEDLL